MPSSFWKIIIDKLTVDVEKSKIPDYLIFLMIVDFSYPDTNPRLVAKTNVIKFIIILINIVR